MLASHDYIDALAAALCAGKMLLSLVVPPGPPQRMAVCFPACSYSQRSSPREVLLPFSTEGLLGAE